MNRVKESHTNGSNTYQLQKLSHLKMSSAMFIGYAHKSCSAELVKDSFENALNQEGIVARVDQKVKQNTQTGEEFKVFFVHFNAPNRQLEHMISEIKRNGFNILEYASEFDRRKGKSVVRYWKVFEYKEKPKTEAQKFVPRILTLAEAQEKGITAPKAAAAEVKAETSIEVKTETSEEFKTPPKADAPSECPKLRRERVDAKDLDKTFKKLRFTDEPEEDGEINDTA
jgi:hypothetical protein